MPPDEQQHIWRVLIIPDRITPPFIHRGYKTISLTGIEDLASNPHTRSEKEAGFHCKTMRWPTTSALYTVLDSLQVNRTSRGRSNLRRAVGLFRWQRGSELGTAEGSGLSA